MFHRVFSQVVDEVAANVLLHRFLRRPAPRVGIGPLPSELPGLYSGELSAFYGAAPAPIDLDADRVLIDRDADRVVWDCRFDSPVVSAWPESDRVWCRHWQAQAGDRNVTVVGVDGIVALGTGWFRRLSERLTPQGIDVLMVDAPCNFRRTPAGYQPGQLVAAGDLAHQLALTRQAVLDVWRAVVSLQARGRRVGLVGVSYGGWLTLLTGLVAEGLDFLVALVPPVDIVAMLRHSTTIVRGIRRGIGFGRQDPALLERMARPVTPLHWRPRLPAERIALHGAQYDRLVPCSGAEKLAAAWGARFTCHREAHFRLALGAETPARVAEQVVELCSGRTGESQPPISPTAASSSMSAVVVAGGL